MGEEGKPRAAHSVMIATPHRGRVESCFMHSVMGLLQLLQAKGIACEFRESKGNGWTALNRNLLCQDLLDVTAYTHLFFIDSDERFRPEDALHVLELAARGTDPVGTYYPRKMIDWAAGVQLVKQTPELVDESTLRSAVMGGTWPHKILSVADDLFEVNWLPTGFLCIPRTCLLEFRDKTPTLGYFEGQSARPGRRHGWFAHPIMRMPDVEDEHLQGTVFFGEDVFFTRMWRKLGGKLWKPKRRIEIGHVGEVIF